MPLPSTRIIHPSWSSHHQAAVETSLTGELVITAFPGTGDWDPVTGAVAGAEGATLYSGAFRLQALRGSDAPAIDTAGQPLTAQTYQLSLPASAPVVPPGSRARVSLCQDDPALVGRSLSVLSAEVGSQRFERTYVVELVA